MNNIVELQSKIPGITVQELAYDVDLYHAHKTAKVNKIVIEDIDYDWLGAGHYIVSLTVSLNNRKVLVHKSLRNISLKYGWKKKKEELAELLYVDFKVNLINCCYDGLIDKK